LKSEETYKRLNRVADFTGDAIDTTSKLLSEYDSKASGLNSIHDKIKGTSSEFLKIVSDFKALGGEKIPQLDGIIKQCEMIDSTLNEISMLDDNLSFYSKSQEIIIKTVCLYEDLIDMYNKNVSEH
jgi:hypothetical protein